MSIEKDNIKSFAEHMQINDNTDFANVLKKQNFVKQDFTFVLEDAINAKVHLGAEKISKDMQPYVYNISNKQVTDSTFINLDITCEILANVFQQIEKIISSGKNIIIVGGGTSERKAMVSTFADSATAAYINQRISPGMLTNYSQVVLSGLKRMKSYEEKLKNDQFVTSAEKSKINHLYKSSQKDMGGLVSLHNKSIGAIIVLPGMKGLTSLLEEAKKTNILTIGLCDTNASTLNLNCIVPCNTTSDASLLYVLEVLLPAFKNGHSTYAETQRSSMNERAKTTSYMDRRS